jgi:deazaflavin-dependent oxidoreductase (nitroreductase family)
MRDCRPQSEKTRGDRLLQAFAQTRAGGWLFIHVLPAIDRALLWLSRGRLSSGLRQTHVLLHVRGAKSGLERTTPLLGTKSGETILLVASKAEAARHPAWFHNVRANPDVAVAVNGERRLIGRGGRGRGARATVARRLRPLLGVRGLPGPDGGASFPSSSSSPAEHAQPAPAVQEHLGNVACVYSRSSRVGTFRVARRRAGGHSR